MSKYTVTALTPAQVDAMSLIGKPVTIGGRQFTVHSIEGGDWYAHLSADGMIVVDTGLSGGKWITEPVATIIPAGHRIGEGYAETVFVDRLKRGVSLMKSYI
jgi:hypothetical protein